MPQRRRESGVAMGLMGKFAEMPEKVPVPDALFASERTHNMIDQHIKPIDLRLSSSAFTVRVWPVQYLPAGNHVAKLRRLISCFL